MKKLILALVSLAIYSPVKAATTDAILWGSTVAITINSNSQTASATSCQQSSVIDLTVLNPKPIDIYILVVSSASNSALGSSSTIPIYVAGAPDGVNFDHDTSTITATAGPYTVTTAPGTNLKKAAVLNAAASGAAYATSFSVAQLFGVLPPKIALILCNDTNQTTAASGNFALFTPVNFTNQ